MATKTNSKKTSTKARKEAPESSTEIDLTEPGSDPFGRALKTWLDRWADGFGTLMPERFGHRFPEFWSAGEGMGGVIRIEEVVDDDGITIRGELPGIDPDEDIDITVENGRLNISAERRQSSETEEDGRCRTEFRYGSYRRSITLPAGTDADSISARYDDGILEIRVPIDGVQAQAARIPVER